MVKVAPSGIREKLTTQSVTLGRVARALTHSEAKALAGAPRARLGRTAFVMDSVVPLWIAGSNFGADGATAKVVHDVTARVCRQLGIEVAAASVR